MHACLQSNITTGEFQLLLDVSAMIDNAPLHTTTGSANVGGQQEVGMFFLASPHMEEAVYVGFDGTNVFVDMRKPG